MAKFIIKSSEKSFKVRRKYYDWFSELFRKKKKRISIYKLIFKWFQKNPRYIMPTFINTTFLNKYIAYKSNMIGCTYNPLLYIYLQSLSYYYKHFTKNSIRYNVDINDGIIFSWPNTQMYVTFFNKISMFVFSAGMMRISMQMEDKNKKKSKIVLKNTIKYVFSLFNNIFYKKAVFLKIIKNYINLNLILNDYKNMCKATSLNYIIYEPKLNFNMLMYPRKRSLKKNLRKNKKI